MSNQQDIIVCPKCNSNNMISKVTAVVSAGSTYSKTTMDGITANVTNDFTPAGGSFSSFSGRTEGQTNLASKLNKPYDVENDESPIASLIYWGVPGLVLLLIWLKFWGFGSDAKIFFKVICGGPAVILGVILLIVGVVQFFKGRKKHAAWLIHHPLYLKAKERYDKSYYCQRCDIVFDDFVTVSPDHFGSLLWRSEDNPFPDQQ